MCYDTGSVNTGKDYCVENDKFMSDTVAYKKKTDRYSFAALLTESDKKPTVR